MEAVHPSVLGTGFMNFECSQQLMLCSSADPAPGAQGLSLRGEPGQPGGAAALGGGALVPQGGLEALPQQGSSSPVVGWSQRPCTQSRTCPCHPVAPEGRWGCFVTSRTSNRDNLVPTALLWATLGVYRLLRHHGLLPAASALSRAPAIFSASVELPLIVPLSFVKYPGQMSASHGCCGTALP